MAEWKLQKELDAAQAEHEAQMAKTTKGKSKQSRTDTNESMDKD
jgi:hypothetical protein